MLEVEPEQLIALAYNWPEPSGPPARPRLRTGMDELVEALAFQAAVPLTPARAVADLVASRRRTRSSPPTPATPRCGWPGPRGWTRPPTWSCPRSGARASPSPRPWPPPSTTRPATAVTVAPFDPITEALVELAGLVGSNFTLVEWGADVVWSEATAHRVALRSAAETPGVVHVPVPVDLALTRALIDLAGPVDVWSTEAAADGGRAAYDWRAVE